MVGRCEGEWVAEGGRGRRMVGRCEGEWVAEREREEDTLVYILWILRSRSGNVVCDSWEEVYGFRKILKIPSDLLLYISVIDLTKL